MTDDFSVKGLGELISNIPAMMGYVPTDHLVLIVETLPTNGDESHRIIGPVVVIDLDEHQLPFDCLQALRAINAACHENGETISQISVLIVSENEHRREHATEFADKVLTGDLGIWIDGPLWMTRFGAGETVRGISHGEYVTDTLTDHTATEVAMRTVVNAGRTLYADQDQWRANGGPDQRAEDERKARENNARGDNQDTD